MILTLFLSLGLITLGAQTSPQQELNAAVYEEEVNGDLDKVQCSAVSEGEDIQSVQLSHVTNLDGIESSEDVSLDAMEVRDVAIDLVKQAANLTTGNFSCEVGNDLIAVVIGFAFQAPDQEMAENARAQATVFQAVFFALARQQQGRAAAGRFEGLVVPLQLYVNVRPGRQ